MNVKSVYFSCVAVFSLFFMGHSALGQGTAFSYQGQLSSGGAPANGTCNFKFTLYPGAVTNEMFPGINAIGSVTNQDVLVNNGIFITTLDFGPGVFAGSNYWLQIGVCTNTLLSFTTLQPLQPVLPVPYAIFATSTSNLLGQLPASQLSGTLPASAFIGFTNTVALTNGANLFAGTFSGNGGAITNVNATNLVGILADAQLPGNVALLNSNQTFAVGVTNTFNGVNIFTNLYGNSFSGSFFGNGLVGWIVVPGTTVNASIDTGYLLTNSQMVTVSLPATAHAGDVVRIASAGASGWQLAQVAGQFIIGNFLSYGQTWYLSGAPAADWTSIASSADGTKLVATTTATTSGAIWTSVNSGQTWSSSSPATALWESAASSADGTQLYAAAGNGGFLYYSTNSGSSWPPISGSSTTSWSAIACSSDGTRLVSGTTSGDLYTWTNKVLSTANGPYKPVMSVASSASGRYLVAAIFNGNLEVSSTYGTNWNPAGSSLLWTAVACSSDGSKMAAAVSNGTIYVSSNFGANWTSTAAPTENWTSIASSSDGSKLVAVAARGGIFVSPNWGATWTLETNYNASAGASWSCVTSSSSGNALAAGINNTLTTSTYGIYTAQAAAQTQTTAGTGGSIIGSQGSSVELQCIGNNNYMPVSFCGTIWAQ
jgi:hypothetical protein